MNDEPLNLESLEEDAPLMHLITRSPSALSDAELLADANKLRTLRTSAQTQRAAIRKPTKPKKTFKHLLEGY